ncbi:hypothetical protein M758_UG041100 [Ceratodon purpureus]|nr:hypothetical protein M758_UG041100 [Ceratodon purpureus]
MSAGLNPYLPTTKRVTLDLDAFKNATIDWCKFPLSALPLLPAPRLSAASWQCRFGYRRGDYRWRRPVLQAGWRKSCRLCLVGPGLLYGLVATIVGDDALSEVPLQCTKLPSTLSVAVALVSMMDGVGCVGG